MKKWYKSFLKWFWRPVPLQPLSENHKLRCKRIYLTKIDALPNSSTQNGCPAKLQKQGMGNKIIWSCRQSIRSVRWLPYSNKWISLNISRLVIYFKSFVIFKLWEDGKWIDILSPCHNFFSSNWPITNSVFNMQASFLSKQEQEATASAGVKSLRALALLGAGVSGILSFSTIASADEAEHGLACASYPWPHKGILSSYDHASWVQV